MPFSEFKNLPKSLLKVLKLAKRPPALQQKRALKRLLKKAAHTEFGQQYFFDEILLSEDPQKKFQELLPTYNYNKIFSEWWHKTLEGKPDVTWPGKIKYFALSSGTSESASKYIPVSKEMVRSNKAAMIRQLVSLRRYEHFPKRSIGKGMLMLGGSTELQKGQGWFAGDLSGIQAKHIPYWFQSFYKPGKSISKERDWNIKIDEVVRQAPNWDIGFLVGVPAWIQMCVERVIKHYGLNNIHEMWPNLGGFVHGGVSFEPYKKGFEKLLGKPIIYIETYLSSEGFVAFQDRPNPAGMKLITNHNIFFEFVPFDNRNFDEDGELVANHMALLIDEVEEGKDYALLMSTNAGTWRYLIGDTIRFTNLERCEIIITGRTKHFLSLVGEHLSVDNMNKAIQESSEELNISIPEFTVTGIPHGLFFAHKWYVACNDKVDAEVLRTRIDEKLKVLNDDYAVERSSALKDIYLEILPEEKFMEFMELKGKVGGQHKFPRVLKGKMLEDWEKFLKTGSV